MWTGTHLLDTEKWIKIHPPELYNLIKFLNFGLGLLSLPEGGPLCASTYCITVEKQKAVIQKHVQVIVAKHLSSSICFFGHFHQGCP